MANLKDVIYLSNEDYETLVSTGTVTIDGTTLTYDENSVYITPEELASSTNDGLMSASDKVKIDSIDASDLVHKTGAETLTGVKTFSSGLAVSDGSSTATLTVNTSGEVASLNISGVEYLSGISGMSLSTLNVDIIDGDNNEIIRFGNSEHVSPAIFTNSKASSSGVDGNIIYKTNWSNGSSEAVSTYGVKFPDTHSYQSNKTLATTDDFSVVTTSGSQKVTANGNTLTFGSNAFNSTAIPTTYLKSASVSSNTLTLTKQDNTTVTYTASSDNQTIKGNGTSFGANDVIDIKGSGIVTVTGNATNKDITISASHQSIKSLNTTATTAQSTSASEAINGSGTINLHKVSKTGTYSDLIGTPTLGTASAKDFTTSVTSGSGDLVTSGAVFTAIDNLPEPMVFKGTLGTGGTITSLPTASSSNEGFTYKVITAGTYASIVAKVGDVFVSNGGEWVLIPSGDTDSDSWRNIKVNGTELLGTAISTGAVNFKNGSNVTISGSGNDITISASQPTVNDGTLTIQGSGTAASTFTANQSGNTTLNIVGSGATSVTKSADNEITISSSDSNFYPTTFSWTGGTTSGPTGSLTGSGMSSVSFGAIPSASSSASGIVTTGDQEFAGVKTFKGTIKIKDNVAGTTTINRGGSTGSSVTLQFPNKNGTLAVTDDIAQDLTSSTAGTLNSTAWGTLKSSHTYTISSPTMTGLVNSSQSVNIKLSINSTSQYVKLIKNYTNKYSGLFFIEESTNLYEIAVYYNGTSIILRCATIY